MNPTHIEVRGAHVNNLRHVDVDIPLHQLVAITGRSGSGKSSLAMGVLYAEGMRRYVSALSTYTRRRLGQTGHAAVDRVRHIPSAIALRQRPVVPGVRSTVGTTTEALNVVRLIFSRLGSPRCPNGHQVPPTLAIAHAMDQPNDGEHDMGKIVCPVCGVHFAAYGAEDFAFNSTGACPTCDGTGVAKTLAEARLIPDPTKTIRDGAVASWRLPGRNFMHIVAQYAGIDIDTPFQDLPQAQQDMVRHGPKRTYAINIPSKSGKIFHMDNAVYENAYNAVTDSMATTTNERAIARLNRFYEFSVCPTCHGSRFKPELLTQQLVGLNIAEVSDLSLSELAAFIPKIYAWLPDDMQNLAHDLLRELSQILTPIIDLGLDYLTLARAGSSLSTGELQRIQLARTLRTETTGVLYVLDEPSIGLHPANVAGLLAVMRGLVAQGNSVVVVDHDTAIIEAADTVLEIGPGAGSAGGRILHLGSPAAVAAAPDSPIGPFLTGQAPLRVRPTLPTAEKRFGLTVTNRYNLHDLAASFPINRLSVVTGFSGAGKSTLVLDALVPALAATKAKPAPSFVRDLHRGGIRRVVAIDATPVGKNVRSTVATYTNILDHLRELYASQPAAQAAGYTASHFSYNVAAGACPTCGGTGTIGLDIQYLPDMQEVCPTCGGRRYNQAVLKFRWHDYTIADLLDLSVDSAMPVLASQPAIASTLQTLHDMGLGYLHLGESTPALSGGEAQRLRLTSHMGKTQRGTLFVFDEPSIGLHPLDVQVLLQVFQRLIDQGGTVLTIAHDLDIMANADEILDLGPGGGAHGGRIVAQGTPAQIAASDGETGHYLAAHLAKFQH
ncbi:excinuclease ABC subunit UvrA [Lacticaseibacillus nasuensis]|uniref:UvrABC system protein A n=1 Tax=Lacticaseibacillus nasuensis JCM 17158 TaxID=1291734 RepID=A0A0R1JHJ7_9LACO|nr:excinuclease ABC subunit UvrA [Lacticaseibacillus nasuensis]KRK70475.1 Excinuclease ATPase subunit [Lacticaseibacillus nasuensis JCM 17158]